MRYAKLEGRIKEMCGSQKELAKRIGVNPSYISSRLGGQVSFKVSDIALICKELQIPIGEAHLYFFIQ